METEITEEEATEALQQLVGDATGESEEIVEESAAAEQPEEEAGTDTGAEEVEEVEDGNVHEDDLASLTARRDELEAEAEAAAERFQSSQNRHAANEQILRERFLKKSTMLDRALGVLKSARSDDGASEADVSGIIGEIEGTMNPASASYAAPQQQAAQGGLTDDHAISFNNLMSETGMSDSDATEFLTWMAAQGQPAGIDLGNPALFDGYSRLAYPKWQAGAQEKANDGRRSDAVSAVKTVQRTQKRAAKAAAGGGSPKKQLGGSPKQVDVSKLTSGDISKLVRESVNSTYE